MIRTAELIETLNNIGYRTEMKDVTKNGVTHTGIVVRSNGTDVAPVIYPDMLDSIAQGISLVEQALEQAEDINMAKENLMNKEFVFGNVMIGLQRETLLNDSIVKSATDFDGIEQYLYVSLGIGKTAKVTRELLDTLDVDPQMLWLVAEANTFAKTKVTTMSEILGIPDIFGEPVILVVTSTDGFRGAANILDPNIPHIVHKYLPEAKRMVMLPSSVHEVLLVPDDGTVDIDVMTAMVCGINGTEVAAEEQLADKAFTFTL